MDESGQFNSSESSLDGQSKADLLSRLALMEQMVAEGRESTQKFGWVFVAWGVCYMVASAWACFGPYRNWAWLVCVCVTVAVVATGQIRQKRAGQPAGVVSTKAHTLSSLWISFSIGIFAYVMAAASSGHAYSVTFIAALCFFLGTVNATSASIYRWKAQYMAGVTWWAAGVASLFTDMNGARIAFVIATFFAQIVFGIYLMMKEHQRKPMVRQNA